MKCPPLPEDQRARLAIVAERARNVAVVAGAGTGKTKTIIDRAVSLLAPAGDEPPIAIQRMALITFTRRAAGELRFRIREELLRQLEREARHASPRAALLREALANLDAAFVGTIHGFADRLLRLRPVEASLSPAYSLVEETVDLVRETLLRLRRAADAGSLRTELGSWGICIDPTFIDGAAETLRLAARAGVQMEHVETPFGPLPSVEALLRRMIETRDVAIEFPAVPDAGIEDARSAIRQLGAMVDRMRGRARGHGRLRRMFAALRRLDRTGDAAEAVRIVQDALSGRPLYKSHDFANDAWGYGIYKELFPNRPNPRALGSKLRGPHRWLAAQLVRLFPVVCAMYERVKAEHEVVDYLDLLIKLRTLLRDDVAARRFYQGLFDHVFVDEFQDTDPLQCEIVFFLCEDPSTPPAPAWDAVQLADGKLTIVGDPKQSIYRFRRADIVMYGQAMERLHRGGALLARLETNFRSHASLITFFNQQLAQLLGKNEGPAFDPVNGRANYEDLTAASGVPAGGAAVHVLPYGGGAGSGLIASEGRPVEAAMLARYVRWLLASGRSVRDPDSGQERPVRPGDVAVLARATTNLRLLLHELDALGIQYAAGGGALFLRHPVVRQYLLGLRALADRDDGVAQAALLRPPFFALDWADVVSDRSREQVAGDRLARVQEAQEIIKELRRRRHLQSAGAVARDLIERTALVRSVATGVNGQQTLAALYELAAEIDRRSAIEGLDFDAVTELARSWAQTPVFLDAPEPIHSRAVRVMTIHGAKGLEFPVVILWDGFDTLRDTTPGSPWRVERDGNGWAVSLGAIAVEYPPGTHLLDRERQFAEQERRRMYYVAATRARDLLVLPAPATKSTTLRYATAELAAADPGLVERFEPFRIEQPPLWSQPTTSAPPPSVVGDAVIQEQIETAERALRETLHQAGQPVAVPAAVTLYAAGLESTEDASLDAARTQKVGACRFGVVFGTTVHRALQLVLSEVVDGPGPALRLAADETGLAERLDEAEADVHRSLSTLRQMGLGVDPGLIVLSEYPLAAHWHGGILLSGFIDLLVLAPSGTMVLDFKTDIPVPGDLRGAYPRYALQLQLYAEMVRRAGLSTGHDLRAGLLLTATGEVRWLTLTPAESPR